MTGPGRGASRRDILAGAAVASLGAGGAAAAPRPPAPDRAEAPVWGGDYWAEKGPVRLYMYRKRLERPAPGAASRPAVMLVHGSTLSGRSSFDLKAGPDDFSMMDYLARAGFDVWTMDHENYGRSSRTDTNSDVASGMEDLTAAMAVIRRETGREKVHFFGESSGALRVGMLANRRPELVDRVVLGAFTYTGVGSPTLTERAKRLDFYRANNRRKRDRAMVASIFTRDGLSVSDALVDALVKAEMAYGDSVPTGTYLDMTSKLPLVEPAKIASPVLMVRGEHDGIATMQDVLEFYRLLPGDDKQFAVVAGAHSLVHGHGHRQVWHLVRGFLTMPAGEA
jgi:pimeloyl-ACP methyl ester carboxylesterase